MCTDLRVSCHLSAIPPALFRPFCPSSTALFRPFCPTGLLLLAFFDVAHHFCERNSNSSTLFRFIVALLRLSGLLHFHSLCICGVILLSFVCISGLCVIFLRFEHHCCVLFSQGPNIVMGPQVVPSMYTTPMLLAYFQCQRR